MSPHIEDDFGKWRSYLWPVYRYELPKLLPMMAMLFLVCLVSSALRTVKDTVMVTAVGAEVLPFIKFWGILPGAVAMTCLFTWLSRRYSQERVFYLMISGFLLFYAAFALWLYPNQEAIQLDGLADFLTRNLPVGLYGLIEMIRQWSLTLFYISCELWSGIVLGILFWGFSNEVTKVGEAKRFYGVFNVVSNMGAIAAGLSGSLLLKTSGFRDDSVVVEQAWSQTFNLTIGLAIVAGLLSMAIFRWLNVRVLSTPDYDELHHSLKTPKKKSRLSIRDSIAYLSNHRYLLCIAVLVLAYNLSMNLVEVVWKKSLRELYPAQGEFQNYMNWLTTCIGLVSMFTSFTIPKILSRFGWTTAALITPFLMLFTSAGVFGFYFFQEHLGETVWVLTGMTPLAVAVLFGGIQNCLSKAAKYSVFDATKEMAFIPLDHETKLQGKAAIDGIGSRLGKSGGSVVHQVCLVLCSSLSAGLLFIALVLFGVIFAWIGTVRSLGKQFAELVRVRHEEPVEPEPDEDLEPQTATG